MLGVELFRRVTGRHALFRDARRRRAKHHLQVTGQPSTPDPAPAATPGEETETVESSTS
jgi:hypothetical protein